MNKNIILLLSLLTACSLSFAKIYRQHVGNDAFLETNPEEQELTETAECNDDQSLILAQDAGISDIHYSNNDFIFQFALPPYSPLLDQAGWHEYIMGWIYPVEAKQQLKCFMDIELELSDSPFSSQDLVVVDSLTSRCQPSKSVAQSIQKVHNLPPQYPLIPICRLLPHPQVQHGPEDMDQRFIRFRGVCSQAII